LKIEIPSKTEKYFLGVLPYRKEKIMVYRGNTNRVNKLKWNPLEMLRQSYPVEFAADFSLVTHTIHIQFSLNCRLSTAVNILYKRIAELVDISRIKFNNHKKIRVVFKQRKIESNQYDNLSPPRFVQ